jgi:fatty-acyl-CoA synthase
MNHEGMTATGEESVALARDHLAHSKCPDAVEFGPLPKTSVGKVQNDVLRAKEWTGQEARIGAA